jgi:hypothetical protein
MSGTSPILMLSGSAVSDCEVEGDQCGKGFRDFGGVINCRGCGFKCQTGAEFLEHAKQGVEMRSKQREVLMSKMEQVDQSSADDGADVRIVEEDSCCTNKMSRKRKFSLEEESVYENENKKLRIDGQTFLLVFYDLEICDGKLGGEIYQIGAKTSSSEFCSYFLPKGSIDWGVTKYVGGIKIAVDSSGERQLVNKERTFQTVNSHDGFKQFLDWIRVQKSVGKYKNVILIAHGDCDMPVLLNNLARDHLLEDFKCCVDYFANALRFFQANYKDWTKFKLVSIYNRIFPEKEAFKAHDALEDAKALCDIIRELCKGDRDDLVKKILEQSFDVEESCEIAKKRILKSLSKSARKKNAYNNSKCLNFSSL